MLIFRIILFAFLLGLVSSLFRPLDAQDNKSLSDLSHGFPDTTSAINASSSFFAGEERKKSVTLGGDLLSSYIWRGTRQGRGPHIQPYAEYASGLFAGGVWGTFDLHGYREIDLYLSFDLPGGFALNLQDYWMADQRWGDFTTAGGSHALEVGIGYESDYVSFSAGYILNEAGGAGSYGGDLYLESRFSFDYFTVIMGAGNGWHTLEGQFTVCCIGLDTGLDIPVSDSFVIPVSAQMVYNPDSRMIFCTAGISLSAGISFPGGRGY